MTEENVAEEHTEETALPEQELKKVKKGLSLSHVTVASLLAKSQEVGKNQSQVADDILAFGIGAYQQDTGMEGLTIVYMAELQELQAAAALPSIGPGDGPDTIGIIPDPEPAPTKRGHREKLRVPGMNQLPGPQQPFVGGEPATGILETPQADGLYRPTMGQGAGPLPPQAVDTSEQPQQGLTQQEMDYIAMRIVAVSAMSQPYAQQQPVPPMPVQQPAQPVQFAASYPPGYTGPPGVGPSAPVPQPEQPMYQYPGANGQLNQVPQQPQQPSYMQDPYALNIGQQVSQQQNPALTAQGLLSGAQGMNPNVQMRNINMEAAKAALGPNWRQNLHSMTAQNRRE